MIRICSSLSKHGYEVLLVGRVKRSSGPLQGKPYEQKRMRLFFEKGKLFYLEFNVRLFFLLLFQRFDVVGAVDLDTILPCWSVATLKRKVVVYDAHEYYTETPEVVRRPRIKKIWEWVANVTIPKVAHAMTVGEELARIFERQYNTSFAVVRNVPFVKPKAATQKEQPPVILYQGALNEGRGLEQVIEAMHQIEEAQLWMAGEGDLSDQLRELVRKSGLGQRVKFLGYVLPAELDNITAKATIGLNLLENKGLSYYYSLANKAFDYVQHGVPAIHMDFPEYQQLFKQYPVATLISDLQPATIAQAIRQLLSDKERYEKMQLACQKAANEWNWNLEEQKLITFFEMVINSMNRS